MTKCQHKIANCHNLRMFAKAVIRILWQLSFIDSIVLFLQSLWLPTLSTENALTHKTNLCSVEES